MNEIVLSELKAMAGEENVRLNEPMKDHTSFRVGGPAEVWIEAASEEQLTKVLQYLRALGQPFFVLGNGTNLLVGDEGYEGVMVHVGPGLGTIEVAGNTITAGAGALLAQVAQKAKQASLTGLEFAAGIPGSVGGGVMMNAGAYDGELKDVIRQIRVIASDGEILELKSEMLDFGYRTSILQKKPMTVLQATFSLNKGDAEAIEAKMKDFNGRRREKQPLEYPSAGSTFKRPVGYFAGKLIQDAGLAGYTVGGAQVSQKHCGFVINKDQATAKDIDTLIKDVQRKVKASSGVMLEPEVIRLGRF